MAKIRGGSGGSGGSESSGSGSDESGSGGTSDQRAVKQLKESLDGSAKAESSNSGSEASSGSAGGGGSTAPDMGQQRVQSDRQAAKQAKAAKRQAKKDSQQAGGSQQKTSERSRQQSAETAKGGQGAAAAAQRAVRRDKKRVRSAETRGLELAESRATDGGVEYVFSGSSEGQRTRKEFRTVNRGTRVTTKTVKQTEGSNEQPSYGDFRQGEATTLPRSEPEPFSDIAGRARRNVSPIATIGLKDSQLETAAAGEKQLAEQARGGDFVSGVYQTGEEIQIAGRDAGRVVENKATELLTPPEDGSASSGLADAKVGGGTVKEQVAGYAGGVVEFPALVGGGALQASAAAGQSAEIALEGNADAEKTVKQFGGSLKTAGESQVDFAANRPLEAGLVVATPFVARGAVAGGRRAGARVKSGAERAASSERAANLREFARSERGQAQLTGKGKAKGETTGKTKTSETVENTGQVDPRALGKGKPEGRSAGVEPTMGSRRGRSGLSGKRAYAERVRGTKEIEAKAPETDLRTVYDFSEPAAKSSRARAAAASGPARAGEGQQLVEEAQKSSFEEDVTLERSSKTEAELFDVENRGQGQRQGQLQRAKEMQRQAQESKVTQKAKARTKGQQQPGVLDTAQKGTTRQRGDQVFGQGSRSRGRQRIGADVYTGQRPGERTTTGIDETTDQTTITTTDIGVPPGRAPPPPPPTNTGTPNRPPGPPGPPALNPGGSSGNLGLSTRGRQTKIVRNPVASPDEFGEIGRDLGLVDGGSSDAPKVGRKEKKLKRRKKNNLYDVFDIDNL